jgi:transposase
MASASNPASRLLDEIPAFGPLIASAMVAFNPNPSAFRSASDFSAALGLTQKPAFERRQREARRHHPAGQPLSAQDAGGGLHFHAAARPQAQGPSAQWIVAMRARKPERVVAVALANKLARIAWAMMSTGERFRKELYVKA